MYFTLPSVDTVNDMGMEFSLGRFGGWAHYSGSLIPLASL